MLIQRRRKDDACSRTPRFPPELLLAILLKGFAALAYCLQAKQGVLTFILFSSNV